MVRSFDAGQFAPSNNPLNVIPNATFGGVPSPGNLVIEGRFPLLNNYHIFTWSDSLTWVRGSHTVKAGLYVERYRRERGLLFTVDTLEFLARGGRIGKAAAFAGTLLNVKPILSIRDGEVVPVKRVRGERKAFAELAGALETETSDEPGLRLAVAHAAAPERAAELETLVREQRPHAELELVVTLGAVIGAHAGPRHACPVLVRR